MMTTGMMIIAASAVVLMLALAAVWVLVCSHPTTAQAVSPRFRRTVATLLAVAMLLPALPAGFFPHALAASGLKIEAEIDQDTGAVTVKVKTSSSQGSVTGKWAMAVVPNVAGPGGAKVDAMYGSLITSGTQTSYLMGKAVANTNLPSNTYLVDGGNSFNVADPNTDDDSAAYPYVHTITYPAGTLPSFESLKTTLGVTGNEIPFEAILVTSSQPQEMVHTSFVVKPKPEAKIEANDINYKATATIPASTMFHQEPVTVLDMDAEYDTMSMTLYSATGAAYTNITAKLIDKDTGAEVPRGAILSTTGNYEIQLSTGSLGAATTLMPITGAITITYTTKGETKVKQKVVNVTIAPENAYKFDVTTVEFRFTQGAASAGDLGTGGVVTITEGGANQKAPIWHTAMCGVLNSAGKYVTLPGHGAGTAGLMLSNGDTIPFQLTAAGAALTAGTYTDTILMKAQFSNTAGTAPTGGARGGLVNITIIVDPPSGPRLTPSPTGYSWDGTNVTGGVGDTANFTLTEGNGVDAVIKSVTWRDGGKFDLSGLAAGNTIAGSGTQSFTIVPHNNTGLDDTRNDDDQLIIVYNDGKGGPDSTIRIPVDINIPAPADWTVNGAVTPASSGTVKVGSGADGATSSDTITANPTTGLNIVATPATGYHFDKWTTADGGTIGTTTDATTTYLPKTDGETVTANFAANTLTVNVKADGAAAVRPVELWQNGSKVAGPVNSTGGKATFTTNATYQLDGTYNIYVPATSASGDTTLVDSGLTVTVGSNGTGSADVNYWSLTLDLGTGAEKVGFTSPASSTSSVTSTAAYLQGSKVNIYASADAAHGGSSATPTWSKTAGKGSVASGVVTVAADGGGTFTASFAMGKYDGVVQVNLNGSAATSNVTSVQLMTDASTTAGSAVTTHTNGAYTFKDLAGDSQYTHVTVVTNSGSYVVQLADPINVSNQSETVELVTVTVATNPTGTAELSATIDGKASITAPVGHEAQLVTASSNTKKYTFDKWTATAGVTAPTDSGATDAGSSVKHTLVASNTGYTLTANYEAHAVLVINKDVTDTVKEGYAAKVLLDGDNAGDAAKGWVKNEGAAKAKDLQWKVTGTLASKLTITPASPTADLAVNAYQPLKIELQAGLSQGTYTAELEVWDDGDTTVEHKKIIITITVKEGSSASADPSTFTWDTYTESINHDGTTQTQTVKIYLDDITSIKSIVPLNGGSLALTSGTDYNIGTKATDSTGDYIPFTLTSTGLKKMAAAIVAGTWGGTLVVTARDSADKRANVTMKLEDTMPSLTKAEFTTNVTSGQWTKGDSAPVLKLTDSNGANTLTGDVEYKWYINGTLDPNETSATLSASTLANLPVGATVRVDVIGKGAQWAAQSTHGQGFTDLYKGYIPPVSATFKVKAPGLQTAIKVDGTTYTGGDISITTNGTGPYTVNTTTTKSTKYRFDNWTVSETVTGTPDGSFSLPATNANNIFTPSKAATITANWIALAELTYGNGSSTSHDGSTGSYTDHLENATTKATTITQMVLGGPDAQYFNLTEPTGTPGKAVAAASSGTAGKSGDFTIAPVTAAGSGKSVPTPGTYTLTVTTTYGNGVAGETATVVQTIKYTIPKPTYTITLAANANGTLTGNYKGTSKTTTTTVTTGDKTFSVDLDEFVAISATPGTGYKFGGWSVSPAAGTTSDKFAQLATVNSNQYGKVTKDATISATFTPVTDLKESDTQRSASANEGYTGTPKVFDGKVWNEGAKDATVSYTLKDEKKDGTAGSGYFSISGSPSTTITALTTSATGVAVAVNAAGSLTKGVYTATLVIEETTTGTAADVTMSGAKQKWEIPITFTVSEVAPTTFPGAVQLKLDAAYKDAETTVKLRPSGGASNGSNDITLTGNAATHNYTHTAELDNTKTYTIYVDGKNTGLTLSNGNRSQLVQLWTLSVSAGAGGSASAATTPAAISVTGGSGYLDGSNVAVSAVADPGYSFEKWTDNSTTKIGWTSNESTNPGESIPMTAARSVEASFTKNAGIKYMQNYGSTTTPVYTGAVTNSTVQLYGALTRPGYTFVGWYKASTLGGGTALAAGSTVAVNATNLGTVDSDGDYVLYAIWDSIAPTWSTLKDGEYGVDYAVNGGNLAIATNAGTLGVSTYTVATPGTGETGLPDGMIFNNATGAISGKPTETGTFKFTVNALDAAGTTIGSNQYTITIAKATPTASSVTFSGYTDGGAVSGIEITTTFTAPFYNKASAQADKWETRSYEYKKYVVGATLDDTAGTGNCNTNTMDSNNLVAITAPTGNLNLSNGPVDLTVTFTPSTTLTGNTLTAPHQANQTYTNIYNTATVTGRITPDNKNYTIAIDPNPFVGPWEVNVGDTLPSAAVLKVFDVLNKGNQDAYVVYTLEGADAKYFTIDESYNDNGTTDKINKPTGGAADTTLSDAFKIGLVQTTGSGKEKIDTSVAGKYVVTVVAKNYGKANPTTTGQNADPVLSTDRVTITFEVKATDYDGKVYINTHGVASADTANKTTVPNSGSVIFAELDGSGNPSGVTIAGTFSGTAGTDGVYSAKLLGNKTYEVQVDGVLTGKTVTASGNEATVDLYQVCVDQDATSKAIKDVTGSLTGAAWLLPGKKTTVSAPSVFTNGTDNYDFDTATKAWSDEATGTNKMVAANSGDYTMSATSPAAITLTANYTKRASADVKVHYHDNKNTYITGGADAVLWSQTVPKSSNWTMSTTVPILPGYTFQHWSATADDSAGAYTEAQLAADLDLYAIWEKDTATWPAKAKDTYYSERYTASVAASGISTAVTYTLVTSEALTANAEVPAGVILPANTAYYAWDSTLNSGAGGWSSAQSTMTTKGPVPVKAKLVADTTVEYTLPGGLKLNADGSISGRPWEVVTDKPFKVKAASASNADVNWTSGYITITVDKYTPALTDLSVNGAKVDQSYDTAQYKADVVGPILTKKDNSPDGDVWSDDSHIIVDDVKKNWGDPAETTTVANGGALALDYAAGSIPKFDKDPNAVNSIKLIWTPGDSTNVKDAAGNTLETIYNPAKNTVAASAKAKYTMTLEENTTWTVKVGYSAVAADGTNDGQVISDTAYGTNLIFTNTGDVTTGALTISDFDANAPFEFVNKPSGSPLTVNAGDTLSIGVKPKDGVTTPGTYSAPVTVTVDNGGVTTSVSVVLTLVVEEKDEFPFQVDTWLNSFDASGAGTAAKGNVTSVVLVELDKNGAETATTVSFTAATAGEYTGNLKTDKTYMVKVNGVELPGVRVTKSSPTPLRVDLYQLTTDEDENATGTAPTVAPTGTSTSSGYYLPGETVTVTANTPASGYKFENWDLTTEGGANPDNKTEGYSTTTPLSYTMGTVAVKLTANYSLIGARFEVVLDTSNGGTLVFDGAETYLDVLSGGKAESGKYMVDDKAAFGLPTPVDPAVSGKYNITKADSVFLGWSTDKNATSGDYNFTASSTLASGDGDGDDTKITLYAIWGTEEMTFDPVTITGTYMNAITNAGTVTVKGGNGSYTFSGTPKYNLTLNTDGTISGLPNDVGSDTAEITVTDTDNKSAKTTYTFVIDKAEVEPDSSTPLPDATTPLDVKVTDDINKVIKDALDGIQMNGKVDASAPEPDVSGDWVIVGTAPTTVGDGQTVKVMFVPKNDSTAAADRQKDGDHYKNYEAEIVVNIKAAKLITDADLDTAKLFKLVVGDPVLSDTGLNDKTNTVDSSDSKATVTTGGVTADKDVSIKEITWSPADANFQGGVSYTMYVTLVINDGSDYRFEVYDKSTNTAWQGSTIVGKNARLISGNSTLVTLAVDFPKAVTLIDFTTNTPMVGKTSNTVEIPDVHKSEYEFVKDSGKDKYHWERQDDHSIIVGSGTAPSQVTFEDGKLYDLVVTIQPKAGITFDTTKFGPAMKGQELATAGTPDATVNTIRPPKGDQKAILEDVKVDSEGVITELTIRYTAFEPKEKEIVGLEVVADMDAYYAQTGAAATQENHYETATGGQTGNVGSKSDVSFIFDKSNVTVYPIYRDETGKLTTDKSSPLPASDWAIGKLDSSGNNWTDVPANFEDQYNSNNHVTDWHQAPLMVRYGTGGTAIYAAVPGSLTVQQLRADRLAQDVGNTVAPKLKYTADNKTFVAPAGLTATVSFNTDITDLSNDVTGLTAAAEATVKAGGTENYFFEMGPSNAPLFVAHAAGAPSTIDTGAFTNMTTLVDGTTDVEHGKTLFMTYVDANHNVVRAPLGVFLITDDLTVDVIDENGHDPEYGDKLTAQPTGGKGPNYTYQWEIWEWNPGETPDPDHVGDDTKGSWKPIPNADQKDYTPDKEKVHEYIRVEATDGEGTKKPSDPLYIEARSLNFIVSVQDKAADGNDNNIHSYAAGDFTPDRVLKDQVFSDTAKQNPTLDANGKPTFTNTALPYGGVLGGDTVTITSAGAWNADATAGRPPYQGAAVGAPGNLITWPAVTTAGSQISAVDTNKVSASKFVDYTLNGPTKLDGTTPVYRFAPQDKQERRGTILGGNGVVHVDVSFEEVPTKYELIPGTPMKVTEPDETRPGESTVVGAKDTSKNFVATWYTGKNGVSNPFTGFDPVNPDTSKLDKPATGTDKFQPDEPYTVVVQVKPQYDKTYNKTNDPTANDRTRFYFHFGTFMGIEVTVNGVVTSYAADGITPTAYDPARGGLVENGGKWYMWYKFDEPQGDVRPPIFVQDPAPNLLSGTYYANTEDSGNDHHYQVNGTDHTPTQGGKGGIGFTFDLTTAGTGAQAKVVGAGLKVDYKGQETTLTAANYGTYWRLVAGINAADAATSGLYLDTVNGSVYGNKTFHDTLANSSNWDSAKYDGKNIYVMVDGQIVGEAVSNNKLGALTVKQLEAKSIAGGAPTQLAYVIPAGSSTVKFNPASTDLPVSVTFNTNEPVATTYTAATYDNDKAPNHYFYQYQNADGSYTDLTASTDMTIAGHHGNLVYVCYKDVNDHIVRTLVGKLSITQQGETPSSTAVIYVKNLDHALTTNTTTKELEGTQYGDRLEAVVAGLNDPANDQVTYVWQRWNAAANAWENIKEADGTTDVANKPYIASKADVGTKVRAVLTTHNYKVTADNGTVSYSPYAGAVNGIYAESDILTVAKKQITATWTWTYNSATPGTRTYDGTANAAWGSAGSNNFAYTLDTALADDYFDSIDSFTLKAMAADGTFAAGGDVGTNKTITLDADCKDIDKATAPTVTSAAGVTYKWSDLYDLTTVEPVGNITPLYLTWDMFKFEPKVKVYDGTTDVYAVNNFQTTVGTNSGAKLSNNVAAGAGLWSVDATKVTDATVKAAIEADIVANNVAYTNRNSAEGNIPLTAIAADGTGTPHDGHSVISLVMGNKNTNKNLVVPTGTYYIHKSAINPIKLTVGIGNLNDTPSVSLNANPGVTITSKDSTMTAPPAVTGETPKFTVNGAYENTNPAGNKTVTILGVKPTKSDGIMETEENYFFVWDGTDKTTGTVTDQPASDADIKNDITVMYGDPIPWSDFTLDITIAGVVNQGNGSINNLNAVGLQVIYQDEDGWHFATGSELAKWDIGDTTAPKLPVKIYTDAVVNGVTDANTLANDAGKTPCTTGNINVTQRPLTITPTWNLKGKYYDRSDNALGSMQDGEKTFTDPAATGAVTFTYQGVAVFNGVADTTDDTAGAADVKVAAGYTATFPNANVDKDGSGNVLNKTITVNGATLTGSKAKRYTIETMNTTQGYIKPRPITVTFDPPTVPVDTSAAPKKTVNLQQTFNAGSANVTVGTILGSDTVTVATTGTYADVSKPITAGTAPDGVQNVTVSKTQPPLFWDNANYAVEVVEKINGNVVNADLTPKDEFIQHVSLLVTAPKPEATPAPNAAVTSVISKQGNPITPSDALNSAAPAITWTDSDGNSVTTFERGKSYVATITGIDDKAPWKYADNVDFSANGSSQTVGTAAGNSAATVVNPVTNVTVTKVETGDPTAGTANTTYTVTVTFAPLDAKQDLEVWGNVTVPTLNGPISSSQIDIPAGETRYELVSGSNNWYTDPACTDASKVTSGNFGAGVYYAKLTVKLTAAGAKQYQFTNATNGYINDKTAYNGTTTPFTGTQKTFDNSTGEAYITLVRAFKIEKEPVVVHVMDKEPVAGNGTVVNGTNADIKKNPAYPGYDLDDRTVGTDTWKGQWFTGFDGTTNTVSNAANQFVAGETYYMEVTVSPDATHELPTKPDGYVWDLSPKREAIGIRDLGGGKYAAIFEYRIPKADDVKLNEVPGNATPPVAGETLDPTGWTSEYFDVVGNVTWYDGSVDKDSAPGATAVTGAAAPEHTYTAAVTVMPKPGTDLTGALKYLFNNADITNETTMHVKNPGGSYTLYHAFTTGKLAVEEKPSNELSVVVTPPVAGNVPDKVGLPGNDITQVVGDVIWTVTNTGAPAGEKFEYETGYTATVKVKPDPNKPFDPTDPVYKFNGQPPMNDPTPTFNPEDGTYTLVYNFPDTGKKEPGETVYVPSGGGGGGTTVVETPVVTYALRDLGVTMDLTAEKVNKNKSPKAVPKVEGITGLKFVGWSETDPATVKGDKLPTLVDPTTFKITADKTFYAVYEKVAQNFDHTHYVIGFPDGSFGPDHQITRGQVATIIARSCLSNFIEGSNYGNPGNYNDVESHWAFSAISYCSLNGVFTGYGDGTFRPDQYITRQELATVVARLAGVQVSQGLPFSDSDDIASWAVNGVYTNYANGWVNGYTDGTFKPLNDITRAETVKIFNGYLHRGTDKEGLSELREYVHSGVASNNTENGKDEYMTWPDVAKTHWAYYEVIEAANDHNFHWRDQTKEIPPEDWDESYIDEKWRYNDDANDGPDDVGREDTLPTLTVTYVVKSNGVVWESLTEEVTQYSSPDPAKLPKAEPSEGFRFAGWSETDPDTGVISLIDPTAHPVLEDRTFYAVFERDVPAEMPEVTITYVIGEHGSTDMALTETIKMWESPTVENLPKITAHEGWRFAGWSETDPAAGTVTQTDPTDHPALTDSTFYAVYEPEQATELPKVTVTYVIGDQGSTEAALTETLEQYQSPAPENLPQITAHEGWTFLGWSETDPAAGEYVLMDPTTVSILADKSFYAVYQANNEPVQQPDETQQPDVSQGEEPVAGVRYSYINGYDDNTFHPDDVFTRATAAAIIANLKGYDPSVAYEGVAFDDLDGHWAANSIAFCVSQGLMSGYTDNTFRPDNAISRQEFAVVLTRVAGQTESGELPFADADSIASYAKDSVYTAYARGWIGGYDDGTFLPERNVTRAEAVKMFNGYLGRSANREYIEAQSGYLVFEDVPATHWAYFEIIEATNTWNQ